MRESNVKHWVFPCVQVQGTLTSPNPHGSPFLSQGERHIAQKQKHAKTNWNELHPSPNHHFMDESRLALLWLVLAAVLAWPAWPGMLHNLCAASRLLLPTAAASTPVRVAGTARPRVAKLLNAELHSSACSMLQHITKANISVTFFSLSAKACSKLNL